MSESCESCRFYKWTNGSHQGVCRRHAPSVVEPVSTFFRMNQFPATESDNWCGEFQSARDFFSDGTEYVRKPMPEPDKDTV